MSLTVDGELGVSAAAVREYVGMPAEDQQLHLRAYRPGSDDDQLWALKRAFETELGANKDSSYEAKLTAAYREEYLEWATACQQAGPTIVLAETTAVCGYVFVLPEQYAYIWDSGVINELYVTPAARGTGVVDGLLGAALALIDAQELPLDRVLLDVGPQNERAQAVYRRYGFTRWGELYARSLGGG